MIFFLLISILLCIFLAAFFSGNETGFFSLNSRRIALLKAKNSTGSSYLEKIHRHTNIFVSSALVGTNLFHVTASVLLTYLLQTQFSFHDFYVNLIAALVLTPLLLLFSEILPKTLFAFYPYRLTVLSKPIFLFFHIFLSPVGKLCTAMARGLDKKNKPLDRRTFFTRKEFAHIVKEIGNTGAIEIKERRMLDEIIELSDTTAEQVMTPRTEITALPLNISEKEFWETALKEGHSKFPVFEESLDEIKGILNVFSLLRRSPQNKDWNLSPLLTPPFYVSEHMKADELLQKMRTKNCGLAIVVDEYGALIGIVTIEDILEEVFGEIEDEHDTDDPNWIMSGPSTWIALAKTPIEEVVEFLNWEAPAVRAESLGGLILEHYGSIPKQGDTIHIEAFSITILDGTDKKIERVIIRKERNLLPEEKPQDEEGIIEHEKQQGE